MCDHGVLIIHGGGLVDPSKLVLMRIAANLTKVYKKVFLGYYSFESFFNPDYIVEYNEALIEKVKNSRGTIFGTCRGINLLSDPILLNKAISCLTELGIKTVVIAGGDGSIRQSSELSDVFETFGINIIFPIPLTIDGMNGTDVIGINEAVKESIRQIENIVSTSLMTHDNQKPGVVGVETQGRDRDDILARCCDYFDKTKKVADFNLSDINFITVPRNYPTNRKRLLETINNSEKPTLVLVSEGSRIKLPYLVSKTPRKMRTLVIGHPAQANQQTHKSPKNVQRYYEWIDAACRFITDNWFETFCITRNDGIIRCHNIQYLAELNPKENAKPTLNKDLESVLKKYTVK